MKKFITLLLVLTGMVSTASAWGDMYLICYQNDNWSKSNNASDFKFTAIDANNFTLTVPGSYASSSDWYFRFREKDSKTWYNIGPESVALNVTNTAQYVSKNGNDTYAFGVNQGTYTDIRIYITWKDSKWHVSAVTGGTYNIAFTNPSDWATVKAYMYLQANSAEVHYLGDWNNKTVSYNATANIHTLEVPAIAGKIIFSDGGSNETSALTVADEKVYDASTTIGNQTVSARANGKATYSSAYPLDFSSASSVIPYTVSSLSTTAATLTEVKQAIPAKTGLIIMGDPDATQDFSPVATCTSVGTNKLQPSVTATAVAADYAYVLSGGKFHPANAGTIPANRAFLLKDDIDAVGGAHSLDLMFDNTTGISTTNVANNWLNGDFYNLAGQRVVRPTKGLYIVNGKKVIIK